MCFSPWRGVLSYYTFIASFFTRAINCTKQVDMNDHCVDLLWVNDQLDAQLRYMVRLLL